MELKWTLFKDRKPYKHDVYITDFSSWVCIASDCFQGAISWEEYASKYPERGWAEIPIPEVPERPKEISISPGLSTYRSASFNVNILKENISFEYMDSIELDGERGTHVIIRDRSIPMRD